MAAKLSFSWTGGLDALLRPLEIELICLIEFARLLRRARHYGAIVLPMYGCSFLSPRRAHLIRAAYCLARRIDDVVDGDCHIVGEVHGYVRFVLAAAVSDAPSDPGARLACYVRPKLEALSNDQDQPWRMFMDLIAALEFDCVRRENRLLLDDAVLKKHFWHTFSNALDIVLCIAGARLRARDIQPLIAAQTALYSIRDLESDMARGLVNIPSHVLSKAQAEGASLNHRSLVDASAVQRWIAQEVGSSLSGLVALEQDLRGSHDFRARLALVPLLRGLTKLARNLNARNVGHATSYEPRGK